MISKAFGKNYTVKRQATDGRWENGYWIDGQARTLTVFASIQPLSAREKAMLPEGDRLKDSRRVYTSTKLTPGQEPKLLDGDEILISGERFQIAAVEDWTHLGIRHFKAYAHRMEQNEYEPEKTPA